MATKKDTTKRDSFKFTLQTGNLPQALAATATTYTSKPECKISAFPSHRLTWIGFKITSKAEEAADFGAIFPASFVVQTPAQPFTAYQNLNRGEEFLTALCADYQDSRIIASANKETTVDPLNLTALIAEYFETGRGGITQKAIKEWIENVFQPAFVLRQAELNATAEAEGRIVKSDAQVDKLTKDYSDILARISKPEGKTMAKQNVRVMRTTLARLVEVGCMVQDEVCTELLNRCESLLTAPEELLQESV